MKKRMISVLLALAVVGMPAFAAVFPASTNGNNTFTGANDFKGPLLQNGVPVLTNAGGPYDALGAGATAAQDATNSFPWLSLTLLKPALGTALTWILGLDGSGNVVTNIFPGVTLSQLEGATNTATLILQGLASQAFSLSVTNGWPWGVLYDATGAGTTAAQNATNTFPWLALSLAKPSAGTAFTWALGLDGSGNVVTNAPANAGVTLAQLQGSTNTATLVLQGIASQAYAQSMTGAVGIVTIVTNAGTLPMKVGNAFLADSASAYSGAVAGSQVTGASSITNGLASQAYADSKTNANLAGWAGIATNGTAVGLSVCASNLAVGASGGVVPAGGVSPVAMSAGLALGTDGANRVWTNSLSGVSIGGNAATATSATYALSGGNIITQNWASSAPLILASNLVIIAQSNNNAGLLVSNGLNSVTITNGVIRATGGITGDSINALAGGISFGSGSGVMAYQNTLQYMLPNIPGAVFGNGGQDAGVGPKANSGSNKAGQSFYIFGAQSTGTGAGSSIYLQTCPQGAVSGSTPQTNLTRMSIDSTGIVTINNSLTVSNGVINYGTGWAGTTNAAPNNAITPVSWALYTNTTGGLFKLPLYQ